MRKCAIVLFAFMFLIFGNAFSPLASAGEDNTWVQFINGSNEYWSKDMANDIYSGMVSDELSQNGVPAYRFELHDTDPNVWGSKRSEISENQPNEAAGEYTYKFSIYLPEGGAEDYALDPVGSEIIAQWHSTPDPGEGTFSPALAIHTGAYYNDPDHYTLEVNYDARAISTANTLTRARYDLGSFTEDKGRWVDWTVHVKWGWLASQSPTIEITKDGEQIFELINHPNTTNDKQGVYMKLGVYKWDWAQGANNTSCLNTRVIYFNNVSISKGDTVQVNNVSPDQIAAQAVIDQINQLPINITLTNQDAVEAARAAYDGLTDAQQTLVTNYDKLTAAEATIDQLLIDQPVAQVVIDQIDQLPADITQDDQAAVEAARTAYDALTDSQQALVTNYRTLTAAEATIVQLTIDQPVAQVVINQIDQLPDEITLEDQETVEAARAAYDALTNSQQALVTNYSELTLAETVIETLLANQADSTLSALKLSSGTLTPQFDSDTKSYTAKVANTVTKVTVTATANSSGASIKVNNVNINSGSQSQYINLAVGSNTIEVLVTAPNGSTTTYTIAANRASTVKSADNTLQSMTLSTGTLKPVFNPGVIQYTTTVNKSVSSIDITPVVNDANATVTVNGKKVVSGQASQSISLRTGKNTIKIVVTAENGKTKTYTIVVTRTK